METINEKCILITKKEYNEMKNEIAELKPITRPLKVNIILTQGIINGDISYQYTDVQYSNNEMLDLSEGIKNKILKIARLFTSNMISNVEKINRNLIKTNLLNNFKIENLSFLEKIVLNKTLSRINNAFNLNE